MGREVRRVPKGWEHPRNERGYYRPLYDQSYREAAEEWLRELHDWENDKDGERSRVEAEYGSKYHYYWDWNGRPPDQEYYRPEWAEEPTCYQVYETVSEGTPTSPVFETEDELLAWLVAQGHSERSACLFIKDSWAPSMVIVHGQIGMNLDGLELLERDRGEPASRPS